MLLLVPAMLLAQTSVTIEITGLEGPLLEQAKGNITIQSELEKAKTSRAIQRLLRQATAQIDNALKANGYYSAAITPHVEEDADQRHVEFRVDKGEPVRIDRIELDIRGPGATLDDIHSWRRDFPLHTGDILVDEKYSGAITGLQRIARKYGLFDSHFSKREILVNRSARQADISITFETGPRYLYSDIQLNDDYFDKGFLARFVNLKPGQPFDNDDLQLLYQRLSMAGYFSSIRVAPVLEQRTNSSIPVRVDLERRKRDRYFAGIGYSTDLGIRGKLGMERRYVNPRGHSFDALIDYALLKRLGRISYEVPLSRPYAEKLKTSLSYSDRRDEDLISLVKALDVMHTWKQGLHDWYYGAWLFTVSNKLDDVYSDGKFFSPTAGWSYARADDIQFPRRAWQLGASLVGAARSIFSTESFLQLKLNARLILPLFQRDRLLLRGRLGRTLIDDFDVLPKQLRFYAGGDNSVRGYEYQSLAPRNENGSLVGGDTLVFGSIEYEHYFTPLIGVAAFWDAGNAFFADSEGIQLSHGAGFGLHLNLPFGIFRLDLANALSEPDHPWRLHLTLRPDL